LRGLENLTLELALQGVGSRPSVPSMSEHDGYETENRSVQRGMRALP